MFDPDGVYTVGPVVSRLDLLRDGGSIETHVLKETPEEEEGEFEPRSLREYIDNQRK